MQTDSLQDQPLLRDPTEPLKPSSATRAYGKFLVAAVIIAPITVWCYWPTISRLVEIWKNEPDYSHGFLVVPLAILFLWARRDSYPVDSDPHRAWGWLLICLGLATRWLGAALLPGSPRWLVDRRMAVRRGRCIRGLAGIRVGPAIVSLFALRSAVALSGREGLESSAAAYWRGVQLFYAANDRRAGVRPGQHDHHRQNAS